MTSACCRLTFQMIKQCRQHAIGHSIHQQSQHRLCERQRRQQHRHRAQQKQFHHRLHVALCFQAAPQRSGEEGADAAG